jgi:hypothetical protein
VTIPAHVQNRDVHAAQTALDALMALGGETHSANEYRLQARGVLAAFAADVREAGYLEGVQVGRRQMAHVLWDALHDEGFAPLPSDPEALDR